MSFIKQNIIDFTLEEKIEFMESFLVLYSQRPVENNLGGMKIPHLYNLYLILKKLKPKLIIESGVWHGQGTWFMERVCPDAKIISFDIDLSNRRFISEKVEYYQYDFSQFDWVDLFEKEVNYNSRNTLLFLDDHVDFNKRIENILNSKFRYVVSEDNYPSNQGDCITPKKILESNKYVIDKDGHRQWKEFEKSTKLIFEKSVVHYEELAPIYEINVTRWGDSGDIYRTPKPHFRFNFFDEPIINEEMLYYTWICLMEFTCN